MFPGGVPSGHCPLVERLRIVANLFVAVLRGVPVNGARANGVLLEGHAEVGEDGRGRKILELPRRDVPVAVVDERLTLEAGESVAEIVVAL